MEFSRGSHVSDNPIEGYRAEARRRGHFSAMRGRMAHHAHRWLGLYVASVWAGPFDLNRKDDPPPIPDDCQLRRLVPEDIEPLSRDEKLAIDPLAYEFAFAHDHMPLGLFIGPQLVHYTIFGHTVAPGPHGMVIRLRPGLMYIWRTYTHPDFRGRRLIQVRTHFTRQNWHSFDWGREFNEFASYIDLSNASSMIATGRLSDELVGYAGFWHIGEQALHFRSPGSRKLGFSFDTPRTDEERTVRLMG